MNFTPGPWHVANGKDVFTRLGAPNADGRCAEENDGWQIADCGQGICFIGGSEVELSLPEQRANARLIAAAPTMLEALQTLDSLWLEVGVRGVDFEHAIKQARSAIAKATGEIV